MIFRSLQERHTVISLMTLLILVSFHPISFADADKICRENRKAFAVIDAYDTGDNIGREKVSELEDAEREDDKNTAIYWYNLGVDYDEAGMYKEAIEAYKQAIRIKPDYAEAHYNMGVLNNKLGMDKEAIEAYKQAVRIKPDYAVVHYSLGVSYLRVGDRDEALKQYEILKDLAPAKANKLFNQINK